MADGVREAATCAAPEFDPTATMEIRIPPVEARFVRATVDPKDPSGDAMVCIDEFEVYAPAAGRRRPVGGPHRRVPHFRQDFAAQAADRPRPTGHTRAEESLQEQVRKV